MPTCPACQTNYSLTASDTPCPRCGAPTPPRRAQPWYSRWYAVVGIVVFGIVLLLAVGAIAGGSKGGHQADGSGDATSSTGGTRTAPGLQAWKTAGVQLAVAAREHDDAVTANNPVAALKAEQSIADKCQQAAFFKPGGDQEQRVRAFCSSVGHPVPVH